MTNSSTHLLKVNMKASYFMLIILFCLEDVEGTKRQGVMKRGNQRRGSNDSKKSKMPKKNMVS